MEIPRLQKRVNRATVWANKSQRKSRLKPFSEFVSGRDGLIVQQTKLNFQSHRDDTVALEGLETVQLLIHPSALRYFSS